MSHPPELGSCWKKTVLAHTSHMFHVSEDSLLFLHPLSMCDVVRSWHEYEFPPLNRFPASLYDPAALFFLLFFPEARVVGWALLSSCIKAARLEVAHIKGGRCRCSTTGLWTSPASICVTKLQWHLEKKKKTLSLSWFPDALFVQNDSCLVSCCYC